jgi:hypothetical protein
LRFDDKQKMLAHLGLSFAQINSIQKIIFVNSFSPTIRNALTDSLLLNMRLIIEFFDGSKKSSDFDSSTILPDVKFFLDPELIEFKSFIDKQLAHFSMDRLPDNTENSFILDVENVNLIISKLDELSKEFSKNLRSMNIIDLDLFEHTQTFG